MILIFFILKLKLTLKLIFPPEYFQILRQKFQNPFIWKTLKFGGETIEVQIGYTGLCVTVHLYSQVSACSLGSFQLCPVLSIQVEFVVVVVDLSVRM
jgi:hypothetical protein